MELKHKKGMKRGGEGGGKRREEGEGRGMDYQLPRPYKLAH
jgi:hypothetical protein